MNNIEILCDSSPGMYTLQWKIYSFCVQKKQKWRALLLKKIYIYNFTSKTSRKKEKEKKFLKEIKKTLILKALKTTSLIKEVWKTLPKEI